MIEKTQAIRIVGIDPGLTGGVALVEVWSIPETDGSMGMALGGARPMPIVTGPDKRKHLDLVALLTAIREWAPGFIVVERQLNVVPGRNLRASPATMYNFGKIMGALEVAAPAWDPAPLVTEANPQVWKREMGLSSDKEASRQKATAVFGSVAFWPRKKDEGVAEAGLLALWRGKKILQQKDFRA